MYSHVVVDAGFATQAGLCSDTLFPFSPPGPSSSPSPSLSSSQLFSDEVVAILMTTHGLKMSLPNLTKMYNQAFRTPDSQHPVSSEEMGEALKRLPNFKVSLEYTLRHEYIACRN